MSLRNAVKAFISGLGGKNLLNSLDFCCFLEKLAKKGQILKTFRDYNAQNLEKFEKNQLPFPVFGKIKVFKANFSNFLLKYLENLKNQLTSGEFLSHPVEKINFRFRLKHFFHFQTPFSPTFCHYNAQNMRNLEKKKLTSREKSTSVSCFSSFSIFRPHFHQLFATDIRCTNKNLEKKQLTSVSGRTIY